MGQFRLVWCTLLLLSCATVSPSPRTDYNVFERSAVETVPEHEPLPLPIRSSVESIPNRGFRDEGDSRLPLRDAVEKRPIPVFNLKQYYKLEEDAETIPGMDIVGGLRHYYGAASYLNNVSQSDERLQHGNANLQEVQQISNNQSTRKMVVCYLESWAAYRVPPLAFTAGLVPKSCTHLHYAFATLHPHTYNIVPTNEDYDVVRGGYRIVTGLKRKYPGLKIILSVGGDGSERLFSEMVQEPRRRSLFVDSAIAFMQEHDFDGLELHWVYAGEKDEKEKDYLTTLLYELRERFSSYSYILSTILPPFRYQIEDGYDLSAVSGVTDYVILQAWDMTHDKKGEHPTRALQHSPLHKDPGAASRDQRYDNVEFMVNFIIRRGMAADKLVLGVPLFGRSYTLAPSTLPSPGALVTSFGDEGVYTQTKGLLAYFEICMMEREGKGASGTDTAGNSFYVYDNQWVAYDTPNTILEKMKFVISTGLAGAAAWAVDMDDFRGLCGSPFPILNAISSTLNGESLVDQSSLKIGSCDSDTPFLSSDPQSCAHFHFCTGNINYRINCEDDMLYDPSTGLCGKQDVSKCVPGQSLRISVVQAARFSGRGYVPQKEDFEPKVTEPTINEGFQRLISSSYVKQKHRKTILSKMFQRSDKMKYLLMHPIDIFERKLASLSLNVTAYNHFPSNQVRFYNFNNFRISANDRYNTKKVVCYMTSWAFYRRGDGKFVPEHIDTRLCTHVVYAYASLAPEELVTKEFDPWTDVNNNLYERVTSLQDVKVLLGLGGWTDSAGDKYSRLVSSAASRSKFIQKLIPFLRMHNFKGLHLDWNYPVCWQSNCKKGAISDKANYALFVAELSNALHAARMELGLGVSGYKEVIESAYDLPSLSKSADFLSTMTYDYHGGWERKTGHHTPLSPHSPSDPLAYYSIEYAIKSLLSNGADPKKLLLGLAFYGQSYRLAEAENRMAPGAPAAGSGEPGEFTKQPGMLAYYEICYRVKNLRWRTGRQDKAGPYAFSDNQWVGYDDPKSIAEKVEWALKQGLGGVTAWAVDLDDFNNRCCAEPFPLLRATGRALGRAVPAPPTAACERPPQPVTPAPPTTTTVESDGAVTPSGDHSHHHNHNQQATTWPSWSPAAPAQTTQTTPTTQTTAVTWWPQATSPSTTTTTAKTTTTTTTQKPLEENDDMPQDGLEGSSCTAGDFHAAPFDCEGYLQCEGGVWRKHHCAPGLHWSSSSNRCDWPSSAKCQGPPSSAASTATTTLAPITSRPPRPTVRPTAKPTVRPTARPTAKPTSKATTTTTTTTTRKPTTVAQAPASSSNAEGNPCSEQDYVPAPGDCNSYLHCDGSVWKMQHCAPGLHWSETQKHCDWPKFANCKESPSMPTVIPAPKPSTARPQRPVTRPSTTTTTTVSSQHSDGKACSDSDLHSPSTSCDSYLLCAGGRWRKQQCPSGLHWDKRSNRCDWPEFAMCDRNMKTTKGPMKAPTTTTRKPYTTTKRVVITTRKPIVPVTTKPMTSCITGTYHTHPRCEKFYICVNDQLITQSCAPGLIWRPDRSQCDFPTANACKDRRKVSAAMIDASKPESAQIMEPDTTYCESGQYSPLPTDCTKYRHCLFGKFQEFSCSAGLHWNQERQICDWPQNSKCTEQRITTTTSKPVLMDPVQEPPESGLLPSYKPGTSPQLISEPSSILRSKHKLICYYTNWSWYRPGIGKFGPEDIDHKLCTHILYGFAVLGSDGLITAHDSWADYDNGLYERVVAFKRYGIKVSLALGGWNDSADDKYSKLVNDPTSRDRFVSHAVQFLEQYGFDGLDLDWEYPKCWQVDCSKGPDSDKEAFADLVRELSAQLKAKGLLLSAAVSPNKKVIDAGYDVPVLAKYLDWISVMTYDYHGQWDKKTGHVAPLYYHPDDETTYFNANYTMHYWMEKGAPASKLVMGMPMYGQTFTTGLRWDTRQYLHGQSNISGLNIPAISGGEEGEYTRAKGFLAYYEICERIRNHGWQVKQDPYKTMGPYAVKGNQWVSFDDVNMIKRKVNFIKSLNLAGGMVWALDLDDFRNRCGQGKHPLLNAIKNGLLNPEIDYESIPIAPTFDSHNNIEDDDDDILARPIGNKPSRPVKPIHPVTPIIEMDIEVHTTKKPTTTTAIAFVEERYKVVCYYTNWAWYRTESGKYTPNDIDPSLCTHIVYAFAVLDKTKLVMKPHDTWLDVENKFYEKVVALKSKGVKVLLGLGGWNDSSDDKYSRLVNSVSSRRKFVVHALDFLEQFEFDGLDLDWEYPKCWQVECEKGPSSDKENFANLVKELRSVFSRRGLLLSAAVSGSKRVIDMAYDVPILSDNLDWIALMSYDYHGQWDKKTGHVAPMYASDEDYDKTFNANFTVHYWIEKGASREKLVMGLPMYGQSFALMENSGYGLGAPAFAGGESGEETRARGFLSFYEICERIRVRGWKVVRDPGGRMGPYAYHKDQWVSFDDDYMARHKAEYVRAMGLGGSMVWSLDLDDFTGQYCGCGKSPLLRNVNSALRNKEAPPPCPLVELQGASITSTTLIPIATVKPTEVVMIDGEDDIMPSQPVDHDEAVNHEEESTSGGSMEGKSCSGVIFRADETDCSKYYLCINEQFVSLTCPDSLFWNRNHCDWPEKTSCRSKAKLRITGSDNKEVITDKDKPILACYFTNWAYYRQDLGKFGPEQVNPSLCTHIIYAWAHLDENTNELVPGIPELDVENDFYGKIIEFRMKGIKVILGAGGLEDSDGDKWSIMAASSNSRATFIESALKLVKQWSFNGLQVAWQYPVCKQTPCDKKSQDVSDRDNFSALLLELSRSMKDHDLELSAKVSATPEIANLAYDPLILTETVDWLAIAANDFLASTTGQTDYLISLESKENSTLAYWSKLMPANQLVMSVPAYARSYTLRDASKSHIGAPVVGPGEPGPHTKVPGFMAYYEICSGLRSQNWKESRDEFGTFSVMDSQWSSYLRPAEVHRIASSSSQAGWRGVALWALDLDDWGGQCGCSSQPLLTALRQGLVDPTAPPPLCP